MVTLTEEQRLLKESAQRFLERVVAPRVPESEASGEFAWDLWPEIAQFGFVGTVLPPEHGGQGSSRVDLAILMEAAGYHWLGLRALLNVANMVAGVLAKHGSDEHRERYLRPLLAGQRRVWVAITEPNHGSDVNGIETTARDEGDHFVVNGTKQWITNGAGDFGILLARVVDDKGGDRGLSAFLIDKKEVRYTVKPLETMILRSTGTSELGFVDAQVPKSALIGQVGDGLRTILTTLNEGRVSVAAGAVGAAQRALDLSLEYARSRTQFGRPIGEFQLVQASIAQMATLVAASRLLYLDAAAALDHGEPARLQASIAKKFATESAHQVASLALQVHGGSGYSTDLPLERIFRDTRGGMIPEGTSEIQTLIIGRELLGLSAFGESRPAKRS